MTAVVEDLRSIDVIIPTAECPEINVSQCHFVHHKCYRDWLELKLRPPNTLQRSVLVT